MKKLAFSYLALSTLLFPLCMCMSFTDPKMQDVDLFQIAEMRYVDLFSQIGGKGYSVPCPPFLLSDVVFLYVNVTYNGWPEQQSDVAFQIFDPHENSFILSERTNASGIATVSFCLPSPDSAEDFIGAWRVIASVNIAEVIVIDILEFHVRWNLADLNNDLEVNVYDLPKCILVLT